jgi:hypothetical protein
MQKQVAYEIQNDIGPTSGPPETPPPEVILLASASARPVESPARALQRDLAAAFGAKQGWSVRRTVVLGAVYHAAVLSALGMAAFEAATHFFR